VTPKRPALVPVELWEQLSEPLQVVISAMVEYYEQRIAKLEADVQELTARLKQNSQNSSKPPSSDGGSTSNASRRNLPQVETRVASRGIRRISGY
jgi:hypothetical protein